ncbi:MAG TPA: flagellar assembly protein FliW [Candidatus Limnocylindria bacterium]|nr:flagellar assembly protein FliW [Candidatus Limnocylindria bacterium]
MKVADTFEVMENTGALRIQVPAGLLGLEHIKEYELVANPAEEPFVWLQSAGTPDVAFLLVSPFVVMSDYQPDICDSDAEAIELRDSENALVLNIVTLHGESAATVNLKGPIVINRHTKVAKQIVLQNAADYSVRHQIAAG